MLLPLRSALLLGASLTFCQRFVRSDAVQPSDRRPEQSLQTQRPRRISRADTGPKFSPCLTTIPRRNVSVSPHLVAKGTTCSQLGAGENKPGDYFTHYCTLVEQRCSETRFILELLGRADIGADSPRRSLSAPLNITVRAESASQPLVPPLQKTRKVEVVRFIHPFVAPQPSLPLELVTGRGDSSNAIFVTPSWDSLSPLLPHAQRSPSSHE